MEIMRLYRVLCREECKRWQGPNALEKDIKYPRVFRRPCVDSSSINVPVPSAFGAEPAAIQYTPKK